MREWLLDQDTPFAEKGSYTHEDLHELCRALGFRKSYLGYGAVHVAYPVYGPDEAEAHGVPAALRSFIIEPCSKYGEAVLSQVVAVTEAWFRARGIPL